MSVITIGFDPGVQSPGIAVFVDGVLTFADQVPELKARRKAQHLVRAVAQAQACIAMLRAQLARCPGFERLVFASEWPQVYSVNKSRTDPNSLLPMVAQIGAVATWLAGSYSSVECKQFAPHDWTQGTRKSDHTKRRASTRARFVAACLTQDEVQLFEGDEASDAMDAIGVGLYALGRLQRKRMVFTE